MIEVRKASFFFLKLYTFKAMKNKDILIGKPVYIPAIGYNGIVSSYDPDKSAFVVDTEFGWVSNVKRTDMIDLSSPHKVSDNYCGFSSVG